MVERKNCSGEAAERWQRFTRLTSVSTDSLHYPRGMTIAREGSVPREPQRIVYILKNNSYRPRYYTGRTSNLSARLDEHNAGLCHSTAEFRPWHVDVIIKFADERRAFAFERYLKSGSGSSFAERHLR